MDIDKGISILQRAARENFLFEHTDRLLLAISGGMDSMCMLELLRLAGQPIEVAHVNYGLRGEQSDKDAQLVQTYCDEHRIVFHLHQADTKESAQLEGQGIQEAARQIRYVWFETLKNERNLDWIATAHHQDDAIETFFINLIRGTGIHGLVGIPAKRESIVRPMLCFSRAEIEALVHEGEIPFRHDASNDENYYLRNRVRGKLIPSLQRIAPQYHKRMIKNMSRLQDQSRIYDAALQSISTRVQDQTGDMMQMSKRDLLSTPSPEIVLHHITKSLGFTQHQCSDLLLREHQSGCRYLSDTHQMTLDRGKVLISPLCGPEMEAAVLSIGETVLTVRGELCINVAENTEFDSDHNMELVDQTTCGPTFELRVWQPGDRFHPLGSPGQQKVQDFLTNNKVSLPEKQRTLVLISNDMIVWVVGHRVDERFKVTARTKNCLSLRWTPLQD